MVALIVIGSIILFFALMLSLRGIITVSYSDEISLTVRVLFIKIRILPKKEKKKGPRSMSAKKAEKIRKKKAAKAQKKRKKTAKRGEEHKPQKKEKKSISEILDVVSLVTDLTGVVVTRFTKRLRIKVARMKIVVATDDAATTAIAYGAITQSINLLLPILSDVKNFDLPKNEKNFDVRADFTSDTPSADIKISFSLRVWHLFDIALGALKKFIAHKFKRNN